VLLNGQYEISESNKVNVSRHITHRCPDMPC